MLLCCQVGFQLLCTLYDSFRGAILNIICDLARFFFQLIERQVASDPEQKCPRLNNFVVGFRLAGAQVGFLHHIFDIVLVIEKTGQKAL